MKNPLPFESDEILIAPGMPGQRRIYSNAAGGLVFQDPISGEVSLAALQGLKATAEVVYVGFGGQVPTVKEAQDRLKDVPVGLKTQIVLMPGDSNLPLQLIPGQNLRIETIGVHTLTGDGTEVGIGVQSTLSTQLTLRRVSLLGRKGVKPVFLLQGDKGSVLLDLQDCDFTAQNNEPVNFLVSDQSFLQLSRCSIYGDSSLYCKDTEIHIDSCKLEGPVFAEGSSYCKMNDSNVGVLVVSGKADLFGCKINSLIAKNNSVIDLTNSTVKSMRVEAGASVVISYSLIGRYSLDPSSIYDQDCFSGYVRFNSEADKKVIFPAKRLNNNYIVQLTPYDRPAGDELPWIADSDVNGFTVKFLSPQSVDVAWTISRVGDI